MTIKIEPLGDRVLIARDEEANKTPGGLYIPKAAQEKQARGKIMACGPGRLVDGIRDRVKLNVSVGDHVIFGKFSGTEVEIGEAKYTLVREDDILCVLRES